MFEQTNQTQSDTEELSAAFESGMTGEVQSDLAAQAESSPENAAKTYTVKYNGKAVELSLDELKTRAQMGMNYEHVKSENDRMKQSPAYKTLMRMANSEGIGIEEYVSRMEARTREQRQNSLVEEGLAPERAKQISDMEMRLAAAEQERRENEPYLAFARRFPTVEAQDIPQHVWEKFHETGDLIGAYTEAENERLHMQISAMQQNEKNAQAHIGSVANDRGVAHTDAFLEGLLGN